MEGHDLILEDLGLSRSVRRTRNGRGFGTYSTTTIYVPGPTIVSGSHDRSLGVMMFRKGEPGSENTLDAREMLGPEWQEIVKNGVRTCL